MNKQRKKYKIPTIAKSLLLALSVFLVAIGCTDMDDTYDQFWSEGEIVYPANADSVTVFPGRNRIGLSWIINGDPSVTSALIYWNNRNDSLRVPFESTSGADSISVIINDLEEQFYVFEIYTFDDDNNISIPANAAGRVYGDNYNSLIINRSVEEVKFQGDSLTVSWGAALDDTALGVEVIYQSESGGEKQILADSKAAHTAIFDYDAQNGGSIYTRTVYLPDSLALDMFYTKYDTSEVFTVFSRGNWEVTANSIDPGFSAYNAIDGNPFTYWWTAQPEDGQFPFYFNIDMKEEIQSVTGLYLQPRTNTNDPMAEENPRLNNFEILVSSDNVEWSSAGVFDVPDNGNVQYYDFATPQTMRYIQIVCNGTYRDKPRCAIAEVGIYRR
ncbi:DUF4998 domain-containing protein [Fulvivirga ligni]|uniref:DUF4998 domain-containing protein n=1 Tax=Fulvivirga ligni TaxID=2904246 RepID=UPI001F2AACE6|nr:DUF4998 domain-containing protein [Fulvivirga ligni]UII21459.1 discoidin domain-containing protein [Fulvivirga ligni]